MRELRTPVEAADWLRTRVRGRLQVDSRRIEAGDGFIAWPGAATDGRAHVPDARARGARACLMEAEGAGAFALDGDDLAAYTGLKAATGPIAAEWFGAPSQALDVLAVTGTNGKTSTACWLAQALTELGRPCGLVGTLGVGVPPEIVHTGLTTPDPVTLQGALRGFVDAGVGACAIEASSIGIAERRLDGLRIALAVFTNFTQDHLDYHGSMDAYWEAKAELFRWPGLRAAVVNIADTHGAALVKSLIDRGVGTLDVWTVASQDQPARLAAREIAHEPAGLAFTLVESGQAPQRLATRLIGDYNVDNLLGVVGALRALGVPLAQAVAACRALQPVPGRMQKVDGQGGPLVVVDYAHTPDALDKALGGLRALAAERAGRLWVLFGCGGDRDPGKRPMMAAVAEARADRVVVTSDNPRSEKPAAIIGQILLGFAERSQVRVEADRARAIAQTVAEAAAEDVVLLAGKGHEAWQEAEGHRVPFSDVAHAEAALAARSAA